MTMHIFSKLLASLIEGWRPEDEACNVGKLPIGGVLAFPSQIVLLTLRMSHVLSRAVVYQYSVGARAAWEPL